jgi:hypothetical protein
MSTPRSVSYVLGFFAFVGICAIWVIGGLKSAAVAAPEQRLFFVSDPTASELAIFSLPGLVLKGTITGPNQPHGLCSDYSSNIWVSNTGTQQMLLYTRTGTLIVTLNDPNGFPFACDVDRGGRHPHHHSHDLAAGNIHNMSGPGETEIWVNSTGSPLPSYDYAPMPKVLGEAFDPGDLYIDGQTHAGTFVLAELPAGSSAIHGITVTGGTIHLPGMLRWDREHSYLAVGDRRCDTPRTTCVYHIAVSGSSGMITGKTKFKAYNGHVICDMAQGVIYTSGGVAYLAGADDESACGYAASSVDRWAYPAGGLPINSNHSIAFAHPFGTAITAR